MSWSSNSPSRIAVQDAGSRLDSASPRNGLDESALFNKTLISRVWDLFKGP